MDILADRNGDEWIYKTINIRIKKPVGWKQTIEIIKPRGTKPLIIQHKNKLMATADNFL